MPDATSGSSAAGSIAELTAITTDTNPAFPLLIPPEGMAEGSASMGKVAPSACAVVHVAMLPPGVKEG